MSLYDGYEPVDDASALPYVFRIQADYRTRQMSEGQYLAWRWLSEVIPGASDAERKLISDAMGMSEGCGDYELTEAMIVAAKDNFVVSTVRTLHRRKPKEGTVRKEVEEKEAGDGEGSPLKRSKLIHVDDAAAPADPETDKEAEPVPETESDTDKEVEADPETEAKVDTGHTAESDEEYYEDAV